MTKPRLTLPDEWLQQLDAASLELHKPVRLHVYDTKEGFVWDEYWQRYVETDAHFRARILKELQDNA